MGPAGAEPGSCSNKQRSWSEGERPLIVKVDLGLRNREVGTEAEVESLVENIRERLLEQVRAGQRVRIV